MSKPHTFELLVLAILVCQPTLAASAKESGRHSSADSSKAAGQKSKPGADVDLASYTAYVRRRIQQSWYPPKGSESKRAFVAFKIHQNGTESHLRIGQTSGDEELDASALLAVNDAAPFKELPRGASTDLDLRLTLACEVGPNAHQSRIVMQTPAGAALPKPPQPEKTPASAEADATESGAAEAGVDFGPYMADLQRRIKREWFPPKADQSKRVLVAFKVAKDGKISHLKVKNSSGVATADTAALKAVEDAAPFRDLPDGSPADVDIEFTFDYNVLGLAERDKPNSEVAARTSQRPLSRWTEALLVCAALVCSFLPSILAFKRKSKKRRVWLAVNVLMVPILLLAPDMITMNYYMGTGTLVTTAVLWLLMLVGSMSDD